MVSTLRCLTSTAQSILEDAPHDADEHHPRYKSYAYRVSPLRRPATRSPIHIQSPLLKKPWEIIVSHQKSNVRTSKNRRRSATLIPRQSVRSSFSSFGYTDDLEEPGARKLGARDFKRDERRTAGESGMVVVDCF